MTEPPAPKEVPTVSVVMPMRDEERHIALCLDSILASNYPQDRLEIIVVDGMSTDRSPDIVARYAQHHKNIQLMKNPKKIRVAANNIGIRAASGEIIVSMDAHVLYSPDYIRNCVDLLETTGAAAVGSIQHAVGNNYLTRAIALATTTPFGIGNAEFRYTTQEKSVDTSFLGAWYKKTFDNVGYFNEDWEINGDYELNYRIRKAGGTVLVSPRLKCQYFVRSSLAKLARQYYRYGMWRVKTIVTHPESVRWRHLAPPALIAWLLLSPVPLLFGAGVWWVPVASYAVYTVIAALLVALSGGIMYLPMVILTFWTLHLSWGVGFLRGIIRFGFPRIRISTVLKDILGQKNEDL